MPFIKLIGRPKTTHDTYFLNVFKVLNVITAAMADVTVAYNIQETIIKRDFRIEKKIELKLV
jgi:hypothetical protein